MSSADKNLSVFNSPLPDGKGLKVAIVWAEWNHTVTENLKNGANELLLRAGVSKDHIQIINVPGTF